MPLSLLVALLGIPVALAAALSYAECMVSLHGNSTRQHDYVLSTYFSLFAENSSSNVRDVLRRVLLVPPPCLRENNRAAKDLYLNVSLSFDVAVRVHVEPFQYWGSVHRDSLGQKINQRDIWKKLASGASSEPLQHVVCSVDEVRYDINGVLCSSQYVNHSVCDDGIESAVCCLGSLRASTRNASRIVPGGFCKSSSCDRGALFLYSSITDNVASTQYLYALELDVISCSSPLGPDNCSLVHRSRMQGVITASPATETLIISSDSILRVTMEMLSSSTVEPHWLSPILSTSAGTNVIGVLLLQNTSNADWIASQYPFCAPSNIFRRHLLLLDLSDVDSAAFGMQSADWQHQFSKKDTAQRHCTTPLQQTTALPWWHRASLQEDVPVAFQFDPNLVRNNTLLSLMDLEGTEGFGLELKLNHAAVAALRGRDPLFQASVFLRVG